MRVTYTEDSVQTGKTLKVGQDLELWLYEHLGATHETQIRKLSRVVALLLEASIVNGNIDIKQVAMCLDVNLRDLGVTF